MALKVNKSTTLTATLEAAATTATLTSAVFDNGKGVPLTLEPESSTKMEVILADITGTALTNIVRGQDGSSDVEHTGTPTIALASTPSTWSRHLVELAGWIPAQETWAYASATTITVPAGAASKYSIGDKIKLTQTTVKYFYVTGVADTVLTVNGGTDYTVANAAITLNYYSKSASPVGFPHWFAYTTTASNVTLGTGGTKPARFRMNGRDVRAVVKVTLGTSADVTGAIGVSVPITAANNSVDYLGKSYARDAGTYANSTDGVCRLPANTSTLVFETAKTATVWDADDPFDWTDTDILYADISYEI